MLIRLVMLHQHGQFTPNQWKAIMALQHNKDSVRQSEALDLAAINAEIGLVKEVIGCEMSENELQDLYWRVIEFSPMICHRSMDGSRS